MTGAAIRTVTASVDWSMVTSFLESAPRFTTASSVPLPLSSIWLQTRKQGMTPTLCVIFTSTA